LTGWRCEVTVVTFRRVRAPLGLAFQEPRAQVRGCLRFMLG